jgi:outer membrane immunogenic protein
MRLKLATVVAALGILAAPAFAADIPVRQAPMPAKAPAYVAPMFTWTGFYIGIHGGGGWGQKDWTETTLLPGLNEGAFDVSGWLVGGQIGANYQVGQWVFGIEGDGSYADINGSRTSLISPITIGSKIEALATFTGRIGFAWDMVLIYAKGGGAWARENHTTSGAYVSSFSEDRWGWTVGGGVEVAMNRNWSIRGDYAYIDFGTVGFTGIACTPTCGIGGTSYNEDIKQHLHVFKGALNYRF